MIVLRQVSKSFDGGATYAVRDLSLTVAEGETVALVGASGCGKTTSLKMINRLLEPTSGIIEVGGRNVMELNPVELRRSIGYVFQGIGLFPHMTVRENVAQVPKLAGKPESEYQPKIDELLDLIHLPASEYADRYPHQLSGGQRQRIGFARALAADAKLMLLDEPFGALDPITRDSLQVEFKSLREQLQLTAIIVTHDMAEALILADQIAVMSDGNVIRFGTPQQLLKDPGHDYVAQLLETPRRHGELMRQLEASA